MSAVVYCDFMSRKKAPQSTNLQRAKTVQASDRSSLDRKRVIEKALKHAENLTW